MIHLHHRILTMCSWSILTWPLVDSRNGRLVMEGVLVLAKVRILCSANVLRISSANCSALLRKVTVCLLCQEWNHRADIQRPSPDGLDQLELCPVWEAD